MFIVFEGLDGVGKSTLIKHLCKTLKQSGIDFITTREPGGTPLADEIREMILKNRDEKVHPLTEAFLYQSSRAQHTQNVILPALKKKQWVISDRFTASTLAFQGGGREISMETLNQLNALSTSNLEPNLTILVDLEEDLREARQSDRSKDRIESENQDFHTRVRSIYYDCYNKNKDSWIILNSAKEPEVLFKELNDFLDNKGWIKQAQSNTTQG